MSIILYPSTPLLSVKAEPPDPLTPSMDSSDLRVYAYLKRLLPSIPSRRHLISANRCVAMGLQFSSGLHESYGSRYGNIGVHVLSWISVRILSWLIVKSIASPHLRRIASVTPIPSESCWYSTDRTKTIYEA
ncbi:hypothetical protein Bca101_100022 [Brassica carinata]